MRHTHILPTRALGPYLGMSANIAGFCLVGAVFIQPTTFGVAAGLLSFALYRILVVRLGVCRHLRVGVRHAAAGRIDLAETAFTQSQRFFERLSWLDRHRGLLLGISSKVSLRALSMYNRAHCQAKRGDRSGAIVLLTTLVNEEPGMGYALHLKGFLEDGGDMTSATDPMTWFDGTADQD